MSDQSTRRKFLKYVGLGAGATLAAPAAMAGFLKPEEIRTLNPEQRAFMIRYGAWMDEFTEVGKIQKENPADLDNQRRMMELADKAEAMQPELSIFMQDKDFALIYRASIKRLTDSI